MTTPLLLLVNGQPATGKSWLAGYLGRALAIPVLAKDDLKEALAHALGDPEDSRGLLGPAAMQLLFREASVLLGAGVHSILEAPFDPRLAAQDVKRLAEETSCRPAQLFLRADRDVLVARYAARSRLALHRQAEGLLKLRDSAELEPILINGETLVVDTTSFASVDPEDIVSWARQLL